MLHQPTLQDPRNVLFICNANSARSIMAEVIMNELGRGRFRAFSAGSEPSGAVHPLALKVIREASLPTDGLRSKSWTEFCGAGAAPLDFVFTVCDRITGELCPAWPGQPITAQWGFPDPALVEGSKEAQTFAFARTFREIKTRISYFLALPVQGLNEIAL